jgi:two-component system alkaline phosphatase synthesis response regulator PhoP
MHQENQTILIADDDDDIRELLATVLTLKGYKVVAVTDIDPHALKHQPDLVLLDVLLSGKNGIDVCALFKKDPATADIPVIMFSGLSDAKQLCLNAGADEFIVKPFKIPVLHNIIKNLLNKSAALQSNQNLLA